MKKISFLLVYLLTSVIVCAQHKKISGTITGTQNETIIGATVLEKGTTNGVVTDIDGKFSIQLTNDNATLVISYIGYKTQEIKPQGNTLSIQMDEVSEQLNEVIVIGYGTTTVKSNTGSISSVKADDIMNYPSANFANSLAGKATGIQVIQSSGTPGSAPQIRVRGIGTLTAGSNPLIVVDGFPLSEGSTINSINPNSIESIEILKDAASTAIYGSRGANGIIMITTKSGRNGKPSVTVSASYGVQTRSDRVKLVDAYDYAQFLKEARNTGYVNKDPQNRSESDNNTVRKQKGASKRELIPDYIVPYLNGEQGLTNTDWYDEIFRTAPIQDYNIAVAGGSEKASYSFSGGYLKQEGILLGSDMDKFSANVNLRFNPSNYITMGLSMSPSYTRTNSFSSSGTWGGSLIGLASISYPFFSPYNEDGSYAISTQINANKEADGALCENPLAWATMITNNQKRARLFGNFYTEVKLLDQLKYKINLGTDYESAHYNYFNPSSIGAYRVPAPKPTEASRNTTESLNYIIENTLSYNQSFLNNAHNFQVLLGQSYQKEEYEGLKVVASGFTDDSIENIAGGSSFKVTPSQYNWAMTSYFGRINYNFRNKYMLNTSVRWDGSSRFGANSKWGFFPAVSAAWLISGEDFLSNNQTVEYAKMRLSWGKSGNNQIPNYGALALMGSADYVTDGPIASGSIIGDSPNPDLSWEMTSTWNIGFDVTLMKYLDLSADFYIANTQDLLLNVPVPQQSGYTTSLQNIGEVRNTGFEVRLATAKDIRLGAVDWNSNLSLSVNKDKVLALAPGQTQIISGNNITKIGNSIGELYGYEVIGVYKSDADFQKYPYMAGTQIGDYIIADLNGDNEINADDKKSFGSPAAKAVIGFNNTFRYKDFELTFDIYSELGKKKNSGTLQSLECGEGFMMVTQDYFDNRYHPVNNPEGTMATPNMGNYSNARKATAASNIYFKDASYALLRNLKLAYNLPSALLGKVGINKAQVYVLGNNLFMLTGYKGFNIDAEGSNILEQGNEKYVYPVPRTISVGVNINF